MSGIPPIPPIPGGIPPIPGGIPPSPPGGGPADFAVAITSSIRNLNYNARMHTDTDAPQDLTAEKQSRAVLLMN